MSKVFIPILIFLFAFGVLAQTSNLPDAGLTPDSPFYFLKAWKESIQTFFTFGAENKAKQFLHLAEVRLAEYQKMIEKGKAEIAQKTLEKYEKQLNHALEKLNQAKQQGKDVGQVLEKVSEATQKHQEILLKVYEKVSEQAKKGIENAIKNSKKVIEKITEKKKEGVCIQVITPAKNPATGECKEFPTPCDVPEGWILTESCSTKTACAGEGKMCGGIAGDSCCAGLVCKLDGNYPDASGICVKETEKKAICQLNKKYKNSAVAPVGCECPTGYEFKVIEMGWGQCPQAGMSDCPESVLECVKANNQ